MGHQEHIGAMQMSREAQEPGAIRPWRQPEHGARGMAARGRKRRLEEKEIDAELTLIPGEGSRVLGTVGASRSTRPLRRREPTRPASQVHLGLDPER